MTRPNVAAANAAQPERNQGAPVAWVRKIDTLTDALRTWLGGGRASRIDEATLAQIAAAAQRLATVASEELESRAHRRGMEE